MDVGQRLIELEMECKGCFFRGSQFFYLNENILVYVIDNVLLFMRNIVVKCSHKFKCNSFKRKHKYLSIPPSKFLLKLYALFYTSVKYFIKTYFIINFIILNDMIPNVRHFKCR